MPRSRQIIPVFMTVFLLLCGTFAVRGQIAPVEYQSFEISEDDGVPVLLKHLPDWESVKTTATLTSEVEDLRAKVGNRAVFEGLDLSGGSEAAIASYPAGTLVLIEFQTPQAATAAEESIQQRVSVESGVVHRRIGNYNAIFLDVTDQATADALLGQIKYEKHVQWLGEDPYLLQKFERYIAQTGSDVAISTVFFILMIFATAIGLGVAVGFAYFRFREQERRTRTAYSDAGGLTRLNLDELSD